LPEDRASQENERCRTEQDGGLPLYETLVVEQQGRGAEDEYDAGGGDMYVLNRPARIRCTIIKPTQVTMSDAVAQ